MPFPVCRAVAVALSGVRGVLTTAALFLPLLARAGVDLPALSPEEALTKFRLEPGYKIELVAAEPLVESPCALAWD